MKKKELKNLALTIAKLEKIIQETDNQETRKAAEKSVMELTSKVTNFEDFFLLDELILTFLEKDLK